ncbi:LysR family transcriptional regulator [Microvirga mediterraneensis]|uniref:LysR family transcriptional regulator n=1 Tax=Microvirga mediterraneensis TaxID=2754695 RepID=A0A838BI43_9HYPH|nr:LysR family transcriptional regulator [Microvirga mediterraneensis]MBA1155224.1 LysR family transcriptional regulator [Microvirga mediterraneensis]
MSDVDLADLEAFAAVARARSFRSVARLRGVSASTLSEALRRLETRLGVRLLNRTTRSVTPTEAGQRLLERLGPALSEVAAALDAVNGFRDSPTGTLRLNVPTAVARLVLPPIVGPFLSAYPGIALEVTTEDSFVDVLAAGFDAGIRYDERLEKDMIAVPIGPRAQRFVVAGAPAYFAEHGRPVHPKDILNHACIRHRFASGVMHPWEFERGGEIIKITPTARVIANSIDLEIAAAIQGLGLIATFEGFVEQELKSGILEPVLQDWLQPFSGPFLYYPSRRHMPAPLRAFVDFIKKRERPGIASQTHPG